MEELDIVRLDVYFPDHAFLCGRRGGTALVNPLLDLAKTGVQAHGEGVFTAHLHAVVLLGIVGGGNLDGGLIAVIGGAKIHQRSAAEADIVYVCAGIGDALDDVVVDFLAGKAAVTAHQDFIGLKKFRKEISYLISGFAVPILVVDAADVVCMKSSHD